MPDRPRLTLQDLREAEQFARDFVAVYRRWREPDPLAEIVEAILRERAAAEPRQRVPESRSQGHGGP